MMRAQWVNPEKTTLEVVLDGTTSYVMKSGDLFTSSDLNVTANAVMFHMEEGYVPLPYYNPNDTEVSNVGS